MVLYTPNCQILVNPPNPFPTAVLSGVTYYSGGQVGPGPGYQGMPLQVFNQLLGGLVGYNAITIALTASQAVTVTVRRYLDQQCTIPVGATGTVVTTANSPAYQAITAVIPAMWFDVRISNTSGTTANLTNPGIILMPNP